MKNLVAYCRSCQTRSRKSLSTAAQAKKEYDYDLVIIGCGVGGHGAALHAVECVRHTLSDIFTPEHLSR